MIRKKVLWADIDIACIYLGRKVYFDENIKGIYGIKPTGFIPAYLVSKYAHKEFVLEAPADKSSILIVNSMTDCDLEYKKYSNDNVYASLFVREPCPYLKDFYFYYRKVPIDVWLVFCWDIEYNEKLDYFS